MLHSLLQVKFDLLHINALEKVLHRLFEVRFFERVCFFAAPRLRAPPPSDVFDADGNGHENVPAFCARACTLKAKQLAEEGHKETPFPPLLCRICVLERAPHELVEFDEDRFLGGDIHRVGHAADGERDTLFVHVVANAIHCHCERYLTRR